MSDPTSNPRRGLANPEMITAVSALVVSVIAVLVGAYSAYIDRAYARASVWPRLEIYRSYSGKDYRIGVTNSGTGPALIAYAELSANGRSYPTWQAWLATLTDHPVSYVQSHIGNRTLVAQGATDPLVVNDRDIAARLINEDNFQLTLCYCSIFQQCWVVDRLNQPETVDRCALPADRKFQE